MSLQSKNMEHTYCVSFKKYTGTTYISSKGINDKVKFLKTNALRVSMIKQCFKSKFIGKIKTNIKLLI